MTRGAGAWVRQPAVWLGIAVFVASLAACVATIVLAWRNADAPVEMREGTVMGVPLRNAAPAPPPAGESR